MHAAVEAILERDGSPYPRRELQREAREDAPLALANYLVRWHDTHAQFPLSADVLDALLLLGYARSHLAHHPAAVDALELRLLLLGSRAGVGLEAMGTPLGLVSRQAVRARIIGLQRAPRRRSLAGVPGGGESPTASSQAWFHGNGERLVLLAQALADAYPLATSDLADELEQLTITLEGIRRAAGGTYPVKNLETLTARLRVMVLPELAQPDHAHLRERLGDVVAELELLLAEQWSLLD